MKKIFIPVILVLVLSFIMASCSSNTNSTPATTPATVTPVSGSTTAASTTGAAKTLDIGEIESMTGMFSDFMKYVPQGAKMAADLINSNGGITINGQKYNINLILEDNKSTPDGSAAAADDLIYDKNVKFIAGTGPTPLVIAIDQVTEKAGVLYTSIYQNGTAAEMGTNLPLKFVGSNGTFSAIKAALIYLKQAYPDVNNFAFIQSDDGQIQYDTPEMPKLTSGLGLTLQGSIIGVPPTVTDYTPYAQKAVSAGADAIMIGNAPTSEIAQLIQQIRGLGYTKPIFSGSYPVMSDVLSVAGNAAEGFFGPAIPDDPSLPNLPAITRQVIQTSVSTYGTFNDLHIQGFDAVYTLVQAIQNAQSLDPKTVADSWSKMTTIDTIFGPGEMGGLQTYGVNHNVYFQTPIAVIKNGQVTFGGWIPLDQSAMP